MKATTIIIAAIFSLQVSTLFAGNTKPPVISNNDAIASYYVSLAPTTPTEATFEDELTFDINQLMPTTPAEASFDDMTSEMTSFFDLAPLTPSFADFDDAIVLIAIDNGILAPIAPAEADFD